MGISLETEVEALRSKIGGLLETTAAKPLTGPARKKIDAQLRSLISDVEEALGRIDPISMPTAIFDPSDPRVIGRFTALAMLAQTRIPLGEIPRFYGSGVYAIYYQGRYPLYGPITGSETPIYVGQAAPSMPGARTARDQGERLSARLNEHRKNIAKATTSLDLNDFNARFLVVQSGWETPAEDYLIHLFAPIWNNETKVLFGLGKHGDDAKTRANKRSPWDTLHPGRKWAENSIEDSRRVEQIATDLKTHFAGHPPFQSRADLLEVFFSELKQAG